MSIESQLREALSARADEVGGSVGDPYVRVSGAIAVSRRRRRTAAIAGVAALAALAVAIPSLGELGRDTTTPAKKTTVIPGPSDPRWGSIATWPTRGSLAGDAGFLTAARALLGAQLIFAGDVGRTDRLVVKWQRDDSGADQLTYYTGAVGASPADLRSTMSGSPEGPDTVLLRQNETPDGWLLLLARPTLQTAEVSPTVRIQVDGTVTRTWMTVPLSSGSAVVDLEDAPASLVRVRLGGHDGPVYQPVRSSASDPGETELCGGCGDRFFTTGAEAVRSTVARTLGLSPDDVDVSVRVTGRLDPEVARAAGITDSTTGSATTRVLVATSTIPGGRVVRTAALSTDGPGGGASLMTPEQVVPIDAATAAQQPFTVSARTSDGSRHKVQVFAPGVARVQLISNAPSLYPDTAKVALAGGTAVLTTPGWDEQNPPYRVSTFDATGDLIGTWPLDLPNRDDPYDVMP